MSARSDLWNPKTVGGVVDKTVLLACGGSAKLFHSPEVLRFPNIQKPREAEKETPLKHESVKKVKC
jgi:hypothetical protein